MLFGGLGVLDRSLLDWCAKCKMDRAPRRCGGGGGGALIDGDARADARDEAIIALERDSSLIPIESSIMLEVLVVVCDWLDIDTSLGVEGRLGIATAPWFLIDPRDGGTRGGSLGFSSSGGTEEFRDSKEGWGLGSRPS